MKSININLRANRRYSDPYPDESIDLKKENQQTKEERKKAIYHSTMENLNRVEPGGLMTGPELNTSLKKLRLKGKWGGSRMKKRITRRKKRKMKQTRKRK
jgi:hypothetical protein